MTVFDRTAALAQLQRKLLAEAAALDGEQLRTQYHPLLSPIGWHLRHCAFVEALWIRERLHGDDRLTAPLVDLCMPERAPKTARGKALPERAELLQWAEVVMAENLALLADSTALPHAEWLCHDDYVWHFLIHHHAQHLETIRMARTARALADDATFSVARPVAPADPVWRWRCITGGRRWIGTVGGFGFDNESPPQSVVLADFEVAETPVTCAQYLAFIESGGYRTRSLWSERGWRWLRKEGAEHPYAWRRDAAGLWYTIDAAGPRDLDPEAAVDGLSRHEASAFAAWCGAALPHEYQWEAAATSGALSRVGEAWEWCANRFHPYPGFRFKPYREYSTPWFDGRHFAMRGASRHTEAMIVRPSFRNYYLADARHHFAGVRLLKRAD